MSTSSQTLDAKAPADSCNGVPIPLWIFLGLLWLQLFYALVPSWENGEYYDYGWLVPIAAGLLFWRRWVDESRVDFKPAPILNWVVIGLVFVAVLGIGFLRIAERFDNLWRIPLWIHAIGVVAAHHALLALVRGPKFTISITPVSLLALTAVPLPTMIELSVIQKMTTTLTEISVPIARFQGLPVEISGSALIADGEVLEIDDGCSGIRSLQSLGMLGLFVGELFRLTIPRRVFAIFAAVALAFVFNGIRTITLTWIYFEQGVDAFHEQHDMVGYSTFGGSAVLMLLLGWWMAPKIEAPAAADTVADAEAEADASSEPDD